MKKLLFFALVFLTLASCKTDEPKVFKIDPMATIAIKPDMKAFKSSVMKAKAENGHLSALEIVNKTEQIKFTSVNGTLTTRMFSIELRDTISATPMLKMWGTDILYYDQLIDGTYTDNLILVPDFLEAKNCVLTTSKGDTIAFVSNSVLRSAETQIKALFVAKDYAQIYTVFNNAYTFVPITGEEYRALNQ